MQYLGGKSKISKQICAFLESVRKPNQPFVEPFCGACWITQGMSGPRYASDANEALITMWKAAQSGYEFTESVSRELYEVYKANQDPRDPLTAFIGFGYSYSAIWFSNWVDLSNKRNYVGNPKNTISKKLQKLDGVKFKHSSYIDLPIPNEPCLIYCDPPYANQEAYGHVGKFNPFEFFEWAEDLVKLGHTVVISEYIAPRTWIEVMSMDTITSLRTKEGCAKRVEKLFMHESQVK